MENFFQTNFVWFLVGAIILGIVIVVKVFIEVEKVRTGKEFIFLLSGSLLGFFSLFLFLESVFLVVNHRDWERIREVYLIGVGVLFVSYILYWMRGHEISTLGDSSQKLKKSQKNLKKEIERQKREIKTS